MDWCSCEVLPGEVVFVLMRLVGIFLTAFRMSHPEANVAFVGPAISWQFFLGIIL